MSWKLSKKIVEQTRGGEDLSPGFVTGEKSCEEYKQWHVSITKTAGKRKCSLSHSTNQIPCYHIPVMLPLATEAIKGGWKGGNKLYRTSEELMWMSVREKVSKNVFQVTKFSRKDCMSHVSIVSLVPKSTATKQTQLDRQSRWKR